jgi:hypothetical protein
VSVKILGSRTVAVATLRRSANNALIADLKDQAGNPVGEAKQKFSAGVLFGFKNGGKSTYTLTAGERAVTIDVAATTTVTEAGVVLGRIAPHDGAARIEDSAGAVLALIRPFEGKKGDDPWRHPILSQRGDLLGSLNLMRTHQPLLTNDDWAYIDHEIFGFTLHSSTALRTPALGTVIQLAAPVDPRLGDLLVCAAVDFSVLPRGYIK